VKLIVHMLGLHSLGFKDHTALNHIKYGLIVV